MLFIALTVSVLDSSSASFSRSIFLREVKNDLVNPVPKAMAVTAIIEVNGFVTVAMVIA